MADTVSDLARCLAENAEAVCRHYLCNGRRQGGYWLAGDVHNAPGRSLYVRLRGPSAGKGVAGKWTDAADGGHGDLLDLILAALPDTPKNLDETELAIEQLIVEDCSPSLAKSAELGRASRFEDAGGRYNVAA